MKVVGKLPKLSPEQRDFARSLRAHGCKVVTVARHYGVSLSTMRRYLSDHTVKHHVR